MDNNNKTLIGDTQDGANKDNIIEKASEDASAEKEEINSRL